MKRYYSSKHEKGGLISERALKGAPFIRPDTYNFLEGEETEKILALQLEDGPKPPKNSGKGKEGQGQPAARGQAPGSRKTQAGQVERGREEGQAGRRAARRLPVEIIDALSADSPLEHIDGRGGPIFSRARGNA